MLLEAVLCIVSFLSVFSLSDLSIKYTHIIEIRLVGININPNAINTSFIL